MLKKISRNRSQRLNTAIMFVFLIFFLILVAFTPLPSVSHDSSPLNLDKVNGRKFEISNDMFLKDGTPFRILGGDLHYFRVHPKYWEDRLLRAKALGLNAIQTYVPWNLHEPIQGQFVFDGFADIMSFLELCKKLDLLVMLRPGPYICGEWDLGGFPPWLLAIEPAINLRSSDRAFLDLAQKWWDILLPKVSPLLYCNGGPIIMVQIENEYGSYGNDKAYLHYLVTVARHHLGEDIVLYTTDGGTRETLEKGTLRGDAVFSAVDFTTGDDPRPVFKLQKEFNAPGKSPPLSAEFYTGWLTHWGENTASTGATFTANSLEKILSMNGSAVLYMVHGGTNFGFYSGANTGANESDYKPDITSYDYDAPIRESGDVDNMKYKEIRRVISKYSGKPLISAPPNNAKSAYGRIKLNQESFLYEVISPKYFANEVESENPISMEAIGQMFGFVVYASEYTLKGNGSKLVIPKVHDRAQVFLSCLEDREKKPTYIGIITRWSNLPLNLPLKCKSNKIQLFILVENMGRLNYGPYIFDRKGILSPVYVDGEPLYKWKMFPVPIDNLSQIRTNKSIILNTPEETLKRSARKRLQDRRSKTTDLSAEPAIYSGRFNIEKVSDTYISFRGWSKGVVSVNGVNLGRYWPSVGPQCNLYVPAPLLKEGENTLFILELESPSPDLSVSSVDYPDFSCGGAKSLKLSKT